MSEVRVRRRWIPWWVGVIVAGLCVGFAFVIVQSLSTGDNGEIGIRVFIPVYVVAAYLGLALILNVRIAEVTPKGVRLWLGPVPIGSNVSAARDEIRLCYARHIRTTNKGVELDNFYTVGVETTEGRQIDVYARFDVAETAYKAAQEIARVLNQEETRYRLEAVWSAWIPSTRSHKRQVFTWFLVFIGAIIAGSIWEIRAMGGD